MSHEEDFIKRLEEEQKRANIVKWYKQKRVSKTTVGSLDLMDPNSGDSVYFETKKDEPEIAEQADLSYGGMMSGQMSAYEAAQEPEPEPVNEEDLALANEILARLNHEAEMDAAKKQAEIESALEVQAEQEEQAAFIAALEAQDAAAFNATTGAYSGFYGSREMTDEEANAFADIMNSNQSFNKSFEELAKENQ